MFTCNLCELKFNEKWEVMAHRKLKHKETVKVCKYFIKGVCEIGEQHCWFRHTDAASVPHILM